MISPPRRVGLCTSHQLEALATCLVSWLSSSFGRWITLTRRCLTDTHWRLALALISNFLPCSFQHQEDQEEPLMPPTLATRSQCVAKPKIWTKPNPKLFPIPIFVDTESDTFFDTKCFPIPIPILFSIPEFFETESDTFFDTNFFRNRYRYLFRYQKFSKPIPIPLKNMERFRNRNFLYQIFWTG